MTFSIVILAFSLYMNNNGNNIEYLFVNFFTMNNTK